MSWEWTPERIARLRKLASQGLTSAAIAKNLGITRGAVMGKIRREGVRLATEPLWGPRAKVKPEPQPIVVMTPLKERQGAGPAIAALKQGDCRWPYGDPADDDFHFCSEPNAANAPYCRAHVEAAIGKGATHGYKPWPMRRGP